MVHALTLKEQIQNDMKTALLGGNRFKGDVLRNLKAAILDGEIAAGKRDTGLEDSEIEKIIAKEVKKRHESALIYEQNSREESANLEREEAEVLMQYLPAQLSEAEIKVVVDTEIEKLAAVDGKMMGQVIGAVKAKLGNTADGATIAKLVKQALQ